MEFNYRDYPKLFQYMDKQSAKGQQSYLNLVKAELFVLAFAALIGLFPLSGNPYGRVIAIIFCISFLR